MLPLIATFSSQMPNSNAEITELLPEKVAKKPKVLFKKTAVPGLQVYLPTGTYYAYFKANGRPVKEALGTNVRSTAELKLRDLKAHHRGNAAVGRKAKGLMTFGDALRIYEHQVETDVKNKQSSKDYRQQTIAALVKTWPGLKTTDIRKVTEEQCLDWAKTFSDAYSSTRYNNTLGTLRAVIQIAIDQGYCSRNPALKPRKRPVLTASLNLPSSEKFQAFVGYIRQGGGRHSRNAAHLTEFLAYSGCRKEEASRVLWKHVAFESNQLTILGDPETGTKNWSYRTVPMNPDLAALLRQIQADRGDSPDLNEPVCQVRECQKAMDRAAQLAGIERLTHHNLRDLFATTCIENGVAVPVVALWLGHSDGGALCMKRYVNPRIGPAKEAAALVSFGRKTRDSLEEL